MPEPRTAAVVIDGPGFLVAQIDRLRAAHVAEALAVADARPAITCEWCGHAYEQVAGDGRHAEADDGSGILCLDRPEGEACAGCHDDSGESSAWPCAEYLAVCQALLAGTENPR